MRWPWRRHESDPEIRLQPGQRWPDGHTVGPRERQRPGWPWADLVQPEPEPVPGLVDEPTMRLPVLATPPDPPPLMTRGARWRASHASRDRGGAA